MAEKEYIEEKSLKDKHYYISEEMLKCLNRNVGV